jgi:hypothetical protein
MVEADTPGLLAAVGDTCYGWEGIADENSRVLQFRMFHDAGQFAGGSPEIRLETQRLLVNGQGLRAWADAVSGCAECRVADNVLLDSEAFREEVLEPLILFLIARSGRTPIHASGFVADGLAALLAGRSGLGKSCLARAAYEAGFSVLSDDTVYIQQEPRLRVWGMPRPIHLFPEDAPAGSGDRVRVRNGKLKHAMPVNTVAGAVMAERAALCVLHRGSSASLERIGQREAMRSLDDLDPGFDLLRDDIEPVFKALACNGAWRLTLSAEPSEAISLLSENLPYLDPVAAP